jgi:molecular chaperone DnaK (HSP70)
MYSSEMSESLCRSEMTREKFEELATPVLQRVREPVMHALQTSNLSAGDIASVELCGAASRTPAIAKTLADVFGQEPKRCVSGRCPCCSHVAFLDQGP